MFSKNAGIAKYWTLKEKGQEAEFGGHNVKWLYKNSAFPQYLCDG